MTKQEKIMGESTGLDRTMREMAHRLCLQFPESDYFKGCNKRCSVKTGCLDRVIVGRIWGEYTKSN